METAFALVKQKNRPLLKETDDTFKYFLFTFVGVYSIKSGTRAAVYQEDL